MAVVLWARGVARAIFAFDRRSLEYGFALRCTAGVAIPLAIACAAGHPSAGFAAAIGALMGGFTSLQGIYRSRIAAVLGVTFGIAVFSFLGALVSPWLVALVALTAIVGYGYGTIAQLGMPAGVAALNTTVAFILFSSLPLAPRAALEQSLLLLLGGLVQAVLLLAVWPIDRFAIERRGLAAAYRELAAYAQSLTDANAGVPPIAALATARQIVADQQPLARAAEIARFKRVLDDAEALRHRLGALLTLRDAQHAEASPERAQLALAIATQLEALASTLEGTMKAEELERIRAETMAVYESFEQAYSGNAFAIALARDVAAHLRDATQGIAVAATGRPVRLLFSSAPRPSAYIQTKVEWLSRDAIRIAVILSVAMLLGHTLFSASRGYWIALTAALVLRPDLQSTVVRGFARIAGTLLGAVLAVLAVYAAHGDPVWQSVGIVAAAAVCYLTILPNYATFSTAMTVFVVLALALFGIAVQASVGDRVLDTLIGGTLAMLGYLAFPSWARRRTRPLLADLIDAQRAFAYALLDEYADPQRTDRQDISVLRTRAWKLRTEVEASIDRARAEPHRPHTIGVGRALNILAASQSFALTSMALEAGLETMPPALAMPGLAPFRDALDTAMQTIADALRDGHGAKIDASLQTLLADLSNAAKASGHATCRFVVEYASGYVQAAATLARLS